MEAVQHALHLLRALLQLVQRLLDRVLVLLILLTGIVEEDRLVSGVFRIHVDRDRVLWVHWNDVLMQRPASHQLLLLSIRIFGWPYQISIDALKIVLLSKWDAVLRVAGRDILLPAVVPGETGTILRQLVRIDQHLGVVLAIHHKLWWHLGLAHLVLKHFALSGRSAVRWYDVYIHFMGV